MPFLLIKIDGDTAETVDRASNHGYLPRIDIGRREFYLARDSEEAGKACAEYWRDMAQNDPEEFAAIIGEKRLILWGMGRQDSYGIDSLDSFCKVSARGDAAAQLWAGYDSTQRDAAVNVHLAEELGWDTEGATLDTETLAVLIEEGEFDDIFPVIDEMVDRPDAEDFVKRAEADEEGYRDYLDVARFIPCVAYRHN